MPSMPPSRSTALGPDGPPWRTVRLAGAARPGWSGHPGWSGRPVRPLNTGGGRGGER